MESEYLDISNIQRFSVDDGPGIRTTVFLKGCNLRCAWCHNPENISGNPVLQFRKDSCIHCGRCMQVCERGVHQKKHICHIIDRSLCTVCGKCAQVCPGRALSVAGRRESPGKILGQLLRDKDYYEQSGGGVTFSGGEPMLQYKALAQMLRMCKEQGLHTAVDTAGAVPYEWYEAVLPYTDVFLYDIKCISSELHQRYTGTDNKRILSNVRRLGECGAEIIVRAPFIEGVNTQEREVSAMAEFVAGIRGVGLCQLLPYHDYGVGKYELVGEKTQQAELETPDEEQMLKICRRFRECGVNAEIG